MNLRIKRKTISLLLLKWKNISVQSVSLTLGMYSMVSFNLSQNLCSYYKYSYVSRQIGWLICCSSSAHRGQTNSRNVIFIGNTIFTLHLHFTHSQIEVLTSAHQWCTPHEQLGLGVTQNDIFLYMTPNSPVPTSCQYWTLPGTRQVVKWSSFQHLSNNAD